MKIISKGRGRAWAKGIPKSEEWKKKVSAAKKGKKWSEERKVAFSVSRIGKPSNAKGKHWKHSEEAKRKISERMKGSKHPAWIKDRSLLAKKQLRNDSAYKDWRRKVWERDGFRCQLRNEKCRGKIVAHHIHPWSKNPELRYEINNGITLCRHHHPLRRDDEERLVPVFQNLIQSKK